MNTPPEGGFVQDVSSLDSGKPKTTQNSPYNTFHACLRNQFGCRVQRLCIDAGFSCPNRDGSKAYGGCLFCDSGGSGAGTEPGAGPRLTHLATPAEIRSQVTRQIAGAQRRYRAEKFIAYFQAFSNTYAPTERLRELYDAALADPRVVGLSVGTRADCVDQSVCNRLASYMPRWHVWLEIGLESANQATLDRMNRHETVQGFVAACALARQAGIDTVSHVIFGLPGDSRDDCLDAIRLLNRCGIGGVKIHNLYIDRRAPIAEAWRRGEVPMMRREEYVALVCDALELLNPGIVVHRLTGEAPSTELLAPDWVRDKSSVLAAITTELHRRGTHQGSRFEAGAAG